MVWPTVLSRRVKSTPCLDLGSNWQVPIILGSDPQFLRNQVLPLAEVNSFSAAASLEKACKNRMNEQRFEETVPNLSVKCLQHTARVSSIHSNIRCHASQLARRRTWVRKPARGQIHIRLREIIWSTTFALTHRLRYVCIPPAQDQRVLVITVISCIKPAPPVCRAFSADLFFPQHCGVAKIQQIRFMDASYQAGQSSNPPRKPDLKKKLVVVGDGARD
jgi:hypothetical protein